MSDVRVLIVDDQEPFRRAMAAVVEETDGFVVVGSATTGEESLATAAAELRPDLVLMDVNLPGHRRHRGHPAAHRRSGRPGGGAAVDVRRGPVRPRRVRCRGATSPRPPSARTGSQTSGPRPTAPTRAEARSGSTGNDTKQS